MFYNYAAPTTLHPENANEICFNARPDPGLLSRGEGEAVGGEVIRKPKCKPCLVMQVLAMCCHHAGEGGRQNQPANLFSV